MIAATMVMDSLYVMTAHSAGSQPVKSRCEWFAVNFIMVILLGISLVWPKAADFDSVITGSNPVSSAIFLRKVMKRKSIAKERNCFVRLALFRKAGAHRKSNKAMRKAQKQIPVEV